jgi:hypothetical protein
MNDRRFVDVRVEMHSFLHSDAADSVRVSYPCQHVHSVRQHRLDASMSGQSVFAEFGVFTTALPLRHDRL